MNLVVQRQSHPIPALPYFPSRGREKGEENKKNIAVFSRRKETAKKELTVSLLYNNISRMQMGETRNFLQKNDFPIVLFKQIRRQ